jgi:Fe-S cluster assembly protein SufD
MIDWTEEKSSYLSGFAQFERRINGRRHSWLNKIREKAIEGFDALGFPNARDEEWRFTSVSPITSVPFKPPDPPQDLPDISELSDFTVCENACTQLVFLNGFFSEKLSTVKLLPKGVRIDSLVRALDTQRPLIEPVLAKQASFQKNTFTALNTAFMSDGAFVYLPSGTVLKDPVHLLFLSMGATEPAMSAPRCLILAGNGCQASIVESYAGLDKGLYFTNAVSEICIGKNSVIDHYKLQRESENAFHMATIQVAQENDSSYTSHSLSLGGALVRNNINVVLDGPGADCVLNGLYVTKGRQHVDNHTSIDHARPNCTSRELYKGILDDASSGVFNGRIIVQKDAQKTNAKQTNKNLLLSKHASINTTPQLEIRADDVKCTHGATIGQLNDEELFYLRSRALDRETARTLLTYAFASELLQAVRIKPIQCKIDLVLLSLLSRAAESKCGRTLRQL